MGLERAQTNRLEQAFVHAAGQAASTLLGLGVGGHAKNTACWQAVFALQATNASGEFMPVHDRHAAIGDHQVEARFLPVCKGDLAILRQCHVVPQGLQLPFQQ
ncbi:hypothetical protein D9M73_258240 [compost metagenome]